MHSSLALLFRTVGLAAEQFCLTQYGNERYSIITYLVRQLKDWPTLSRCRK